MPPKKRQGDIDTVFLPPLPKVGDLPVAYLCGQESFCREVGSKEALVKAKRNVEAGYPVVGVIEQLDATLTVLEKRLPYFFQGARNLYLVLWQTKRCCLLLQDLK